MQIEVYRMDAEADSLTITLEAVCDSFSSLLWDIEYYQCGSFEVYIAANPENLSIFQTGRIVGRDDDSQHFGIIESVQIDTDAENGDYLTVRGRFLMCLLERRIIHPTYIVTAQRIVISRNADRAENAELLLQIKEKYPSFSKIDYWWMDDLIERIDFGFHSHTDSELKKGGIDDRTVSIHWKCGIITTLSSGVLRDSQDPRHKAELWDAYLLRYPSQFPKLVEEVRKKK